MNYRPTGMEDARLFAVFGKVIAQQRVQVGVHGCGSWNAARMNPRQAEITTSDAPLVPDRCLQGEKWVPAFAGTTNVLATLSPTSVLPQYCHSRESEAAAWFGTALILSFPPKRESIVFCAMNCAEERTRQIKPAPRAHLYLAPSTATGISVEYGYAGMPGSKR